MIPIDQPLGILEHARRGENGRKEIKREKKGVGETGLREKMNGHLFERQIARGTSKENAMGDVTEPGERR